ncbi:hypothetical protein ABW21_db0203136 [Orbilia brochopaga]|nr:hypothetical protein ABW21_db0203136 [Drechslerella brochopaga]
MSFDADDLAGSSPSSSSSLSLSQLIFCGLVVLLVYRYVISTPQPQDASSSSHIRPTRTTNPAVTADAVESLQAMFPQVSAAAISWDLERNGGSVEATTEKILAGDSLPEVPLPPSIYMHKHSLDRAYTQCSHQQHSLERSEENRYLRPLQALSLDLPGPLAPRLIPRPAHPPRDPVAIPTL